MPPSPDEQDDFLLSCRYGDLDDVQQFIAAHGAAAAAEIQDDNGNTPLHMLAGNGHKEILTYLLPLLPAPSSALRAQNASKSTPLHWAALNAHLDIVKTLVEFPGGPGTGVDLIDVRNAAGRSPLAEAEMAGWDEGAAWLVGQMKLDEGVKEGAADDAEADVPLDPSQAVEIEIEDANGELAKMTIQS